MSNKTKLQVYIANDQKDGFVVDEELGINDSLLQVIKTTLESASPGYSIKAVPNFEKTVISIEIEDSAVEELIKAIRRHTFSHPAWVHITNKDSVWEIKNVCHEEVKTSKWKDRLLLCAEIGIVVLVTLVLHAILSHVLAPDTYELIRAFLQIVTLPYIIILILRENQIFRRPRAVVARQ